MELENRVSEIIVEQLGVTRDELVAQASFIDDLGADSLDIVELVMAMEEEFDIEIPDDEAEKIQTRRQQDEPAAGLFFVKGDVLARLGRNAEAGEAFLTEILNSPEDPRSYCRLSILYALEGRSQEAVGILQRMVQVNPTPAAYSAAVETLRVLGDTDGAARLLSYAVGLFPGNPKLKRVTEEGS